MRTKSLPRQQYPISIVNHELKSQLFGIKAYVQLLQKRLEKLNDEKLLGYSKRIDAQVDTLTYALTDFIDYVKITENTFSLNKEFLDISEVISSTVKIFHAIFPDAQIQITGNISQQLFADRSRMEKVIYALLSNAVAYSDAPATINIIMTENSKSAEISVTDTGIGIEPKQFKNIFDPFYSIPLENRKERIGLGLFVAKKITQLHKGKLLVTSTPGKGSTFTISLPF